MIRCRIERERKKKKNVQEAMTWYGGREGGRLLGSDVRRRPLVSCVPTGGVARHAWPAAPRVWALVMWLRVSSGPHGSQRGSFL